MKAFVISVAASLTASAFFVWWTRRQASPAASAGPVPATTQTTGAKATVDLAAGSPSPAQLGAMGAVEAVLSGSKSPTPASVGTVISVPRPDPAPAQEAAPGAPIKSVAPGNQGYVKTGLGSGGNSTGVKADSIFVNPARFLVGLS